MMAVRLVWLFIICAGYDDGRPSQNDRSWLAEAIRRTEADHNRSGDTHLMLPHAAERLPTPSDDRRSWFDDNARSFRRMLLLRRDGARLRAGSRPEKADAGRIAQKIASLVAAGFREHDVVIVAACCKSLHDG